MNEFQTLVFLGLPGVGRISVKKIIDKNLVVGEIKEIETYIKIISEIIPSVRNKLKLDDIKFSISKANAILNDCESLGITTISYNNELYPIQLKDLGKKAPVLLYAKGDLSVLKSKKNVAIIGTRDISNDGLTAGSYITKQFVDRGYVIVSGLAKGCDTLAHKVCLENEGKTIAVMAHGLDMVYPKENSQLAEQIYVNGCLISEYPPKTNVLANYFVERDRIQSGLSKGVVVIETNVKGGTMHTVKSGTEQRRKIACIEYKEDVILPTNAGNRMLLKEKRAFALSSSNIEQYIESFEQSVNTIHENSQGKLDF
jgi:DNA processing protein